MTIEERLREEQRRCIGCGWNGRGTRVDDPDPDCPEHGHEAEPDRWDTD